VRFCLHMPAPVQAARCTPPIGGTPIAPRTHGAQS
jgi:hypothetical protein